MWLSLFVFVAAFWASIFWGSIKIVDRHNEKNSFGVALAIGVVFAFSRVFAIPDVFMLAGWLVFMLRLVTWRYNLTLLGAIIVTASTIFTPYLLMPPIAKFVGMSELRGEIVIYGLPIAVVGVWIGSKIRNARRSKTEGGDERTIPKARVERLGRKSKKEAPVVAAPTPIVAPKPADPPRADGQPTFLS